MKAEKKVKSYTRRTKSGKTVVVKAHTAKYEAADKKEVVKKKGSGKEIEEIMNKKKTPIVEKPEAEAEAPFTKEEFKEWYEGTGSAADKKVAKALRKQLGRSGYRKFEDEAIDNYTPRGHMKMFKRVSSDELKGSSSKDLSSKATTSKTKTTSVPKEPSRIAELIDINERGLAKAKERATRYKYRWTNDNSAVNPDGGTMKDVIEHTERELSSLKKGREALKKGKLDEAWKEFKNFGVKEEEIYGKRIADKREKARISKAHESLNNSSSAMVTKKISEVQKELDKTIKRKEEGKNYYWAGTEDNYYKEPISKKITYLKRQISHLEKAKADIQKGKIGAAGKRLSKVDNLLMSEIFKYDVSQKLRKLDRAEHQKAVNNAYAEARSYEKSKKTGEGTYGYYIDGKSVPRYVYAQKAHSPNHKSPREVASAILKKADLRIYQPKNKPTTMEVYGFHDRRSAKNRIATITNGRHISFGGRFEKENKKEYSSVIAKALKKAGYVVVEQQSKGAKLTSLQKHAVNALLNRPGWTMKKAEKHVLSLSRKDLDKIAHEDL